MSERLTAALGTFGLSSFRPGQSEVMESVLRGQDVVCVMPTGSGKSLCYQLPALLSKGTTLVISPLISLMSDQVNQLAERGIPAAFVNSTLEPAEQSARLADFVAGRYKLLYVAPERLRSNLFREQLLRAEVSFIAVDEAHCISEWGHDFRPDYLRLARLREWLPRTTMAALTATATPEVRTDIHKNLQLRDPTVVVTGFDRPNLRYQVSWCDNNDTKQRRLIELLAEHGSGPAIIYASTRKNVDQVVDLVQSSAGQAAVGYHAGMESADRHRAQQQFMSGRARVVAATNAFGMGINKPDIRLVVHYNIPGTLEAYYQEAGRAGRDGLPAICEILFSPADRRTQEFFIENKYPTRPCILSLYGWLCDCPDEVITLSAEDIRKTAGIPDSSEAVRTALGLFQRHDIIKRVLGQDRTATVCIHDERDDQALLTAISPKAHVQRTAMSGILTIAAGRREEDCAFPLEAVLARLGLERTRWTNALREIRAVIDLEYTPPFSGYATRVIRRGLSDKELVQSIDLDRLMERRTLDYQKLDRMFDYAMSPACRRNIILSYFGETVGGGCSHCDNCDGPMGPSQKNPSRSAGGHGSKGDADRPTPLTHDEMVTLIRKLLSGVARACPNGDRPGFGKNVIAQMLLGKPVDAITQWKLDQLSTFGLLKEFKKKQIASMLDQLVAAGCLIAQAVGADGLRTILVLTPKGREVMAGRSPVDFRLNVPGAVRRREGSQPRTESGSGDDLTSAERDLFERLRQVRARLAREAGLPVYLVAVNETLRAMARQRPRTPGELSALPGFGPNLAKRFGQAFLDALVESEFRA